MGYMCLFQFWFPQGICLAVGLLGHMVVLFLVFIGISIYVTFCLSIYLLMETCFHLLTIVNKTATKMHVQISLEPLPSTLLGMYLGVELLGHKVIKCSGL